MLMENTVSMSDFVHAIAEILDLASPALNKHHNKVAYLAGQLAYQMDILDESEFANIILAAMLHDIGAFSIDERVNLLNFDVDDDDTNNHSIIGYKLLKDFKPLAKAAQIIRYHHVRYDELRTDVPLGSYIIHLADRVAVLLDEEREIFMQLPEISQKLHEAADRFHPQALAAFDQMLNKAYFWIDIFNPTQGVAMMEQLGPNKRIVGLEALRNLAKVFAQIIDFRSRYTATHSCGVAAVAYELSQIAGFSEHECQLMEVAGYLHDIGKLAIPNSILEKPGPLDELEFNHIRKHTYYTYRILSKIDGLEHVAAWAGYHHERNDGSGYPFKIKGQNLSRLSRIMAITDIVTALAEDRPYRAGMSESQTLKILDKQVESGGIDRGIVDMVRANYPRINAVRIQAQQDALLEYEAFFNADTLLLLSVAA